MLDGGARCRFSLIVLLLVVCYVADWSDDNYSYWVSTRARTFDSANGPEQPLSGGGFDSTSVFLRGGQWKLNGEVAQATGTQPAKSSVIESVFGLPLGATSASTDDATSSSASRAWSTTGNRMGLRGIGRSAGFGASAFSQAGGMSFGQSGGMSVGQAGLTGMSVPH